MSKKKKLTKEQKAYILSQAPEVIQATKLLIAGFREMKLKSHITLEYVEGNDQFELRMTWLGNNKTKVNVTVTDDSTNLTPKL